jgi:hypothetical protein
MWSGQESGWGFAEMGICWWDGRLGSVGVVAWRERESGSGWGSRNGVEMGLGVSELG